MRVVRVGLASFGIAVMLGCGGLMEQLQAMSGAEITVGDGARVPEGFPLAVPAGGIVQAVMTLPAGGMKTTTVTVEVAGNGAGLLEQYERSMVDAGMTVTRSKTGAGDTIAGQAPDGGFWSASVSPGAAGAVQLTLVTMGGGENAAPAQPVEGAAPAEAPAGDAAAPAEAAAH